MIKMNVHHIGTPDSKKDVSVLIPCRGEEERNKIMKTDLHVRNELFVMDYLSIDTGDFSIHYTTTSNRETLIMQCDDFDNPLSLNFSLKGIFEYSVPGIFRSTWHEKTANIFSSKQMGSYSINEKGTNIRQICISFSERFLKRMVCILPEIFESVWNKYECGKNYCAFPEALPSPREFITVLLKLCRTDVNDICAPLSLSSGVLEALSLLLKGHTKRKEKARNSLTKADREKMMAAKDLLCSDIRHPYTLNRLAHEVGTNECKLKYGFKELFKRTVYDFLTEQRMTKACDYLNETSLPISEIALITGFEQVSSFSRAFKRYTGLTPQQYRMDKNSGDLLLFG